MMLRVKHNGKMRLPELSHMLLFNATQKISTGTSDSVSKSVLPSILKDSLVHAASVDTKTILPEWYGTNESFTYESNVTMNLLGTDLGRTEDHTFPNYDMTEFPPVDENFSISSRPFTFAEITWIVLFTIMLSVAIIGNIIIIWIIIFHRRMRTVTNYFLLNLSIADLTMATFNGAPNFVYMLRNDWIFGKILCIINNFVSNWTVASCVFTMMAISIDRWMAIIKPLEPRMTKSSAWMAIITIWIGSALIGSPALIFTSITSDPVNSRTYCLLIWPDGKSPSDSKYEFGYNVFLLVVTYLIPMTAMAICYGSMSWELWGQTQIGEVTQRQINSMISKRKVVRMFIVIVITFAICWLPYHSYFIYMHVDKSIVYITWIQHVYLSFYFLAMSQSSINPLIVVGMNSRFRNYIYDILFNACTCNDEPPPRATHYYAPATPPLFRRYSQSCSHSHSRSRSGTGEENGGVAMSRQHHPRSNANSNGRQAQGNIRKNHSHPYTVNGNHETHSSTHANGHNHKLDLITSAKNHNNQNLSTRVTYC